MCWRPIERSGRLFAGRAIPGQPAVGTHPRRKWDTLGFPVVDVLVSSNFPPVTNILDVPISGTNIVYATNITTITTVSLSPPLKMIRVDCSWPFMAEALTQTLCSPTGHPINESQNLQPAATGRQSERGFSLPELMTSMTIILVVAAGILSSHLFGLRMYEMTRIKLGPATKPGERSAK